MDSELIAWIQHRIIPFLHSLGPAAIVAALIALGSLTVASLAYKNARRATDIAQLSHDEHGCLKSVRIQFIGKVIKTGPDGRGWAETTPTVGNENYLNASTVLSVYGGPDDLNVDQVALFIEYIEGAGFAQSYTITIFLKDSNQLLVAGPRLPEKLESNGRRDWHLPHLAIFAYTRQPAPMKPGLLLMPPYDYMSIKLIAMPEGHTSTSETVTFGSKCGLVMRRHYFNSLDEALAASIVPERLKMLLSVWSVRLSPLALGEGALNTAMGHINKTPNTAMGRVKKKRQRRR
ncbi:MAG: hypothetical protein ACRDTX_07095 [Pseudonocardiaceae bacterium]